jgi:hypothetical protein
MARWATCPERLVQFEFAPAHFSRNVTATNGSEKSAFLLRFSPMNDVEVRV